MKFGNITKYFGFLVAAITWFAVFALNAVHPINWNEPLSQFGYYDTTRVLFGTLLTIAAIVWYLFSLHLNVYWRYSSFVTLLAGICYTIVGWVPYQPYAKTYVLDVHNIMTMMAALLYSLPMVFIAYSKVHERVARVSFVLFNITAALILVSFIVRITGHNVLFSQILILIPATIWLIVTNILLLQHHKELAEGYTGKL